MTEHPKIILDRILSPARVCYQCSTCAGGCPVFCNNPEMNPRLIIEKLILGQVEEVLTSSYIWNCGFCLICTQRCPQGVDLAHILVDLKNLSVKRGNTPVGVLDEMKTLYLTGLTQESSKTVLNRRKKLNLPEIQYPDLSEIQKIMDVSGFNDLLKLNLRKEETSEPL
ncbi:MAG: 4Fe-4S dicluster domain-containing protein [Candidatus Heimdallarchaeota archaeon]|nr:MAG: 4Fe-4S dicluster domain-containing protein [Candidatus Heimdallarchaeota archaeon]